MTIKLVVKSEKFGENETAKTFTFDDVLITLGNSPAASVSLEDAGVAQEQAVIVNENKQPLFINRNKGTILNGAEIEQGVQYNLRSGDRIGIGAYQIYVVIVAENELPPTTYLNPQFQSVAAEIVQPEPKQIADVSIEAAKDKLDARSFKDILKGLRKEEDQYYFQITDADGAKRRITIESDELVLGWSDEQNLLTSNRSAAISQSAAIVRKDWSGITIYPSGAEAVLLNNALLEAGTLLRNNDKIVFSRRLTGAATQTAALIFCEPAALVELNQILPQDLLTNAREIGKTGEIAVEPEPQPEELELPRAVSAGEATPTKKKKVANSRIFGYFTAIQIIIMIVGTIFLAIFTYLLLEIF